MSTKKIIMIEDNPANRMVFKDLLELEGFEVTSLEKAEDALPMAKELNPDLILMDIQLPGMDGLTATKILREDPNTQAIPIVALTSYAMPGDRERALVAGCTGYITKPIRVDSFRDEVKRCAGVKEEDSNKEAECSQSPSEDQKQEALEEEGVT